MHTGHRENGKENENDRERGIDHCTADFDGSIEYNLEGRARLRQMPVLTQAAQDVFYVNNGVIHDHANRDGQAAERHRVQIDSESLEHNDRSQQRERNRRAGNGRRAQLEQEQRQHDHHEHRANQQRTFDVVRGRFDEAGRAKQARVQRDTLRVQRRLQFAEGFFDIAGDLKGVRAELAVDDEADARLAHDGRRANGRLRRFDYFAQIAESDDSALALADDALRQLFRRQRLAFALEDDALAVVLDETRTTHSGGASGSSEHIINGKVVSHEPIRAHLHLKFFRLAAKHGDLRHARHGKETLFQRPIRQRAQLHQRTLFGGQPDNQNGARRRSERRHDGRLHALRQLPRDGHKPLGNGLPRAINVCARMERHDDESQSLDGLRA